MVTDAEILDALREYEVIKDESELEEDIVELLWKLYLKVASDKDDEIIQLEEELHSSDAGKFKTEVEKLTQQVEDLKKTTETEEDEVATMCREEGLDELVGSTRSDQMAYLLVLRTTLLEKLQVTQERTGKALVKEDGEMRTRMNNAMCEMGSMAAKLNNAVTERDKLKKEVAQLSSVLTSINALPPKEPINIENKNKIISLQGSVDFYKGQIELLQKNLNSQKQQLMESKSETQETKELNEKLKEVNLQLSQEEKGTSDGTFSDRYLESQELLKEMQTTLDEDEQRSTQEREVHLKKIEVLEATNKTLNRQLADVQDQLIVANSTQPHIEKMQIEEKVLQEQLAEARRQIKELRAECLEHREDSKRYQREFTKMEVARQSEINEVEELKKKNLQLQQKNVQLEEKLEKTVNELDELINSSRSAVEEKQTFIDEKNVLNEKVLALTTLNEEVQSQLDDQRQAERHAVRLKDINDNLQSENRTLNSKLKEAYKAMEEEVQLRVRLSSEIESLKSSLNESSSSLHETKALKEQLSMNEDKLKLLTGSYKIHDRDAEILATMRRPVLEDAVYALRVRLLTAMSKTEEYAQKYNSLKQKHKTKIRNIRDLFMMERRQTAEEIEKLELRVTLAESALERELQWKDDVLIEVRRTHEDHRKSIDEQNEACKLADERKFKINKIEECCEHLGHENKELQTQLKMMEEQRMELEKLLRENAQKHELNTLLSNLSLSGSYKASDIQVS